MDHNPRWRPEYNTENPEDKAEYRAFGERLVVKHGPECLREGMRVFEDDRQNWMKARQGELEEQYPQFAEAVDRLYEFQHSDAKGDKDENGSSISDSKQDKIMDT